MKNICVQLILYSAKKPLTYLNSCSVNLRCRRRRRMYVICFCKLLKGNKIYRYILFLRISKVLEMYESGNFALNFPSKNIKVKLQSTQSAQIVRKTSVYNTQL